jgi:hypothetical protein
MPDGYQLNVEDDQKYAGLVRLIRDEQLLEAKGVARPASHAAMGLNLTKVPGAHGEHSIQ